MGISKSLSKVQKNIAKKDGGTVHPKGRRFKQLNRATLRHEKLQKEKSKRLTDKDAELVRLRYFQEAVKLDNDKPSYTVDEIQNLVRIFISRDDEELDKEKKARRKGRPKSTRQDMLEQKMELAKQEFKAGFLIPDLTDSDIVTRLKAWEGSAGGVTNLRFVRVAEGDGKLVEADGDIEM